MISRKTARAVIVRKARSRENQISPELNAKEIQIPYDKDH